MATFDGVNIFGQCIVNTEELPVAVQQNAYPGINGLEEILLGSRGAISTIEGWLVGSTPGDVIAAENVVKTKQRLGTSKTFVDNFDNSYPHSRVLSFKSEGRIVEVVASDVPNGGYGRKYTAAILHLI